MVISTGVPNTVVVEKNESTPSGVISCNGTTTLPKSRFACGIATVQLEGIPSVCLADHLWERHRIFTVGIEHDEFEGIRVSPSVYSTLEEVDRFAEAMERVLREGLPAVA